MRRESNALFHLSSVKDRSFKLPTLGAPTSPPSLPAAQRIKNSPGLLLDEDELYKAPRRLLNKDELPI